MDLNTINELIDCLKKIIHQSQSIDIPKKGESLKLELKSTSFYFFIDINRKGRKKPKCTFQLREHQHKDKPLLRLDILGPAHPNPPGDFPYAGEIISCPHLHIAHPEYGDSIAYPLNNVYAKMYLTEEELKEIEILLRKFLERCNVGNINDYTFNYQSELF
ncbi:DUF6978 family protein [Pallidibacillus pasinlerensis]|uniref:Uncharacterized protein n=1 Tax=Pallidibacillus pasinlerensis TaxID=2703818 RepID=A0ABX0A4G1_9BACI|nr:hypothetical protein [Pallidibacillus pasinlerensis]NCU16829.1 hypothetical protein [Pallidibacillus pasinlerensis]